MTMYIRIYICIFEYTYVYSNIHKFDILAGANFEYAVTSNLAATDLPVWCRNHGKGGVYAHDTTRPAIREKILTQCQGLYDAAQKLGKTAYLCDSHAQDPSHVRFIFVTHFGIETDDPIRPFRLNARGEFENPSLRAMADLFIGCMIAHGCGPGVAKNLFYSSFGIVDVLPLLGPPDWHSKKAAYISPNDYDTAMSTASVAEWLDRHAK
jgi:hypothetical protein